MASPARQAPTIFSDELHTVARALSPIQPQREISEIILRPAISSLGAIAGAVLLINAAQDKLELIARQGYEQQHKTIWQDGPLDRHIPAIHAIQGQEALFFEDSETLKAEYPQLEQETGAFSPLGCAVLPIVLDGQALGVLVLDFREPHQFSGAEQQFLKTLAVQCAVALDRSTQHARKLLEHQQLVRILESISDAFYAVDHEWRFTYVNQEAERLWNRRREDLLGKVYWEEFPQAVGSEAYLAHLEAARERRVVRVETRSPILHVWEEVVIHPTPDGLSVYFKDISERKTLEANNHDLTRVLERKVAERTRDLHDLNAELRAYAIGVARDLSEPMRRVDAFMGLLERRLSASVDERVGTLFAQLREEAKHVQRRMNELRLLAVLERRELIEEPVALDQLVVQVRSDLEPLLKGRKVKWVLGTLPYVVGDPMMLRQVFGELLAVSLDATKDTSGAVIEVEGEMREGKAVVSVRHNGLSLSEEEAQRYFEVFHVPSSLLGASERIGLANTRRIVQRHGGHVWAEAAPTGEAGALLFVEFPDRLTERNK
ncbi:GAF domain-containing protein [Deinococcus peraridilitoris]|uniref:histidine kinase n=1 Tax=Deinococcus peraridilitoris (strain DSM 19664 / LMG 22246 / CIP 109416 / KR-200) TaxID=937777 RepID=L0A0W8_DEIPD|nr:GAF domain-containing protein [Deinococcus peraridilitoris]AFZ67089.1 PAS domain S-box [Deinococcus peraridilitoris DSM 19664]